MNEEKPPDVKIDLGAVQTTLLLPLLARANEAEKSNPIVLDAHAKDMVGRIDYDFTKIAADEHQFVWVIRACNFDTIVRAFLANNSSAVVINIGAGLDTISKRVDDGRALWVNIDLPDVVALRRKLIPDSKRETTIAGSVFDFTWINDIAEQTRNRSVLIMAAGVLCYFETSEVKALFRKLADAYPSAHVAFDAMSRLTVWGANRSIMKKSGMDPSARLKWHLKKASHLKRWVHTIKVVEEFPMFSRIRSRDDWTRKMIRGMKIADLLRMYNMVHVQI